MKKTIVIIILAVYIASIAVVNFFGLEIKQFESITYVTGIQCDTVTFFGDNSKVLTPTQYTGKDKNTPQFVFDFIPAPDGQPYTTDPDSLNNNPNVIRINYEVMPHLADNKNVRFEYDEDAGVAIYHELSESFIFLKPNRSLTITIRATDGHNVSTRVIIKGIQTDNSGSAQ